MLGNTGLLKHSANVPQTALLLEDVFRRAGYPEGVFQTLLIESGRVARVIADDRVKAVTLTGSDAAGRSVAEAAGRALKKTVLELGGSDPFIVLPSADLDRAAQVGVQARVQNNGQSCIAAKRFIVHTDVYDAFEELFISAMSRPAGRVTRWRPRPTSGLSRRQRAATRSQSRSRMRSAHGAKVLCGGNKVEGPGFFYEPTVLSDVTPSDARLQRRGVRARSDALPRTRRRRSTVHRERFTVRARSERVDFGPKRAADDS